jgi:hypothetical protein
VDFEMERLRNSVTTYVMRSGLKEISLTFQGHMLTQPLVMTNSIILLLNSISLAASYIALKTGILPIS